MATLWSPGQRAEAVEPHNIREHHAGRLFAVQWSVAAGTRMVQAFAGVPDRAWTDPCFVR